MKCELLLLIQLSYIWASNPHYEFAPLVPLITLAGGSPQMAKKADVQLLSADGKSVVGRIILTDAGAGTTIHGEVWGLTPGYHGFHVHEKGQLGNKCADAGPHFNPDKESHGSPFDDERHAGDLGNIEADPDGRAKFAIGSHLVRLIDGKYDVTGRSVVIHAKPDDYGKKGYEDSNTTGHSGVGVACGIIMPITL